MEQRSRGEIMTQSEVDALVRRIENGEAAMGQADPFESMEHAKRTRRNFKQLEYAMKRCEIENLANVGPEELPARFAQVHYYAHWNWLLQRGFPSKRDFRNFMEREASKSGVTLNWGGRQ